MNTIYRQTLQHRLYRRFFLLSLILILSLQVRAARPTITNFSPSSGPVGTSVTISGTNFSAVKTDNIVFFGATKATVNAATSTTLTVTVPNSATFHAITVVVGGLVASSDKPFIVTFANGGSITANSFAAKTDFACGSSPRMTQLADFDGDGKTDIVLVNFNDNTASVLRNTSTGPENISFATKVDFTTGSKPTAIAIADFDGDGKKDFVVANLDIAVQGTVSVFRNTSSGVGNINFASKVDCNTIQAPASVAVADFDLDGLQDLAVSSGNGPKLCIIRNTSSSEGTISFATKTDFSSGPLGTQSITAGDFDGDAKNDLVAVSTSSESIFVLRNTGDNTINFSAPIKFSTSLGGTQASVGDLDGDGKDDIMATLINGYYVAIFRNTSSGAGNVAFAEQVNLTTAYHPTWGSIGDLDGDGKLDLTSTDGNSGQISVFRNTGVGPGTISFAEEIKFKTGGAPKLANIGDLDSDGKADLTVTNTTSNSISVLRNTVGGLPTPTVTSFTPITGVQSTTVKITGSNFSTTPASNTVKFNGTTAIVTASTATSITTTVPAGATSGKITVTVNGQTGTSATDFTVTTSTQPTIASFSPVTASSGMIVTITGTNFTGTTSVTFGGEEATSFTVVSATSIKATIGSGASGSVQVVTPNGTISVPGFTFDDTVTGIENFDSENLVTIYPNPSLTGKDISMTFPKTWVGKESTISIIDITGRVVYFSNTTLQEHVSVSPEKPFRSGYYIVQVFSGFKEVRISKKMMITE